MQSWKLLAASAVAAMFAAQSLAAPASPPTISQSFASPGVDKHIDCLLWDTPESCDIFCYYSFCLDGPNTWKRTKAKNLIDDNRKNSGANQSPFQTDNLSKFGTTRRGDSYWWTDECPVATSLEGGNSYANIPKAIVQGAEKDEQNSQGEWVNKLWENGDVPEGGQVTLTIDKYDSKKSPNCLAMTRKDKSLCNGQYFYRRTDVTGGKTNFVQMSSGSNALKYG